jgi:predicted nucleic acid-binding protein
MTLIDTSAWIEFLRRKGNPEITRRVAAYLEAGLAAYCGPVEFELYVGAKEGEKADLRQALEFSTRLEFSESCWRRAAGIEKSLRAKGVTVPRDDIFVATAAIHHNVEIYADDPHFELMQGRGELTIRLAAV